MMNVNDAQLKEFINQVFTKFDRDNTGTLEPLELANFFNEVFTQMGNPIRLNQQQAL